ncbi:MAG: ROK family protein [Hyphomicrobiaceae bacterium]
MSASEQHIHIGIDLGGTKIEGVAMTADGTEVARHRMPAPRGDYATSVAAICALAERLDQDAGQRGTVGIGMPGSLSPATGLVRNANSTWLNGQPLQRDLEARLGRAVSLANDANCFALSEAVDGAGAGARLVFGVILGTGCGGGLVHERRVLDGPLGIGGEWGHNPLPWATADEYPGPLCWCGRHGCMETWVSGPAIAADHARVTGASLAPEDIVVQAQGGDRAAQATLDRHASRLARGLAAIVNVIDPDVIVLGGGLSRLAHLYARLPELMAPHIFSDRPAVTIRPPRWGDAGGVRGAAWLWG